MAVSEVLTPMHRSEHGRVFLHESQRFHDADVRLLANSHGRDECPLLLDLTQQACGREDSDIQVF